MSTNTSLVRYWNHHKYLLSNAQSHLPEIQFVKHTRALYVLMVKCCEADVLLCMPKQLLTVHSTVRAHHT
jgi:hypothetical protein